MDYKKDTDRRNGDKEILYSETVKAGKRIYYLDVKCSKRNELYLSLTESKRILADGNEEGPFSYEKHKIFLYQEDFGKFIDAFTNVVQYIHSHNSEYDVSPLVQAPITEECTEEPQPIPDEGEDTDDSLPGDIEIQIDF